MRFKCKICDYVLELKHIRHFVELHPEAVNRFNDTNQKFYDEILDDGIVDEYPIILDADTERRLNDWNKNLTCAMTKSEWDKFYTNEELDKIDKTLRYMNKEKRVIKIKEYWKTYNQKQLESLGNNNKKSLKEYRNINKLEYK